jgi:hypothetical protein
MGNHEWCSNCELDDYHYGRDCDPVRVQARLDKEAKQEKEKTECMDRMINILNSLDVKFEIDSHGHAVIRWWDFRKI